MKINDIVVEVEKGLIVEAVVNNFEQLVVKVRKAEVGEEQERISGCNKYDYGRSNCFVFFDIN